jgi:hypothetical protein
MKAEDHFNFTLFVVPIAREGQGPNKGRKNLFSLKAADEEGMSPL